MLEYNSVAEFCPYLVVRCLVLFVGEISLFWIDLFGFWVCGVWFNLCLIVDLTNDGYVCLVD